MKTLNSPGKHGDFLTVAALITTGLFVAGSSFATTRSVKNLNDSGPDSLRTLIAASLAGDTIIFQAGLTGNITLTNDELVIGRDLTIIGPGAAKMVISGNRAGRIFNILAGPPAPVVNISGLLITGGLAKGADGETVNSDPDGADGLGGGIINSGTLTLTDCLLTGNSAVGGDGDIFYGDPVTGGDALGGAIYSFNTLVLVNCQIAANFATAGFGAGAIDPAPGNNPEAAGPGGDAAGAGIYCESGLATTNCTFCQNQAAGGASGSEGASYGGVGGSASGGGIYVVTGSLVNCTICSNTAVGGDVPMDSGSTSSQGGEGGGGGIYIVSSATLTSCTISGNSCKGGEAISQGDGLGGGVEVGGLGEPILGNTIVGGDSVTSPPGGSSLGPDVYGSIASEGFNLIGEIDGSSGWVASDLTGSGASPLDPQLGPLEDNGGPTPTMALMSTSAAIDQGNSFGFATDQRGFARPFDCSNIPNAAGGDGSDIGACEFYASRIAIVIEPRPSEMVLGYTNNSPGTKDQVRLPIFGLQTLRGGLSPYSGSWENFTNPVRLINNMFIAHDQIAVGSYDTAFYRLFGPMTNIPFIPPAATEPATQITTGSATLNGTTVPIGNNTKYWFQFGGDTNYGQTTAANPVNTSTNPASLSYSYGGLSSLTTYHFQLVVVDDDGRQYGGDQSFTTKGLLPVVVTYSIQDGEFGPDYVVMEGTINAEGTPGLAYFEYGINTNYGMQTPNYYTQNSYDTEVFTNKIHFDGLVTNTFYHFRAVGFNGTGKGVGADETFYASGL